MGKILIALDDSESAMQAVAYAAEHFSVMKDLQILLVHVLPNLPALFWDEGHILTEEEKRERRKVVDKWLADRFAQIEPVFRKATVTLIAQGVKEDLIGRKTISDSLDAADSLLEEAKDSGARTIVLGRRSKSEGARHLLGSMASKIVHHASGTTVIVVD